MSSPGPSISERGINSPARSVVSDHLPISFTAPAAVSAAIVSSTRPQQPLAAPKPKPQPAQQQAQPLPKPKSIVFPMPTITTTNTKPRYVVEKMAASPITTQNNAPVRINQPIKKEVKIYKMTPTTPHTVHTAVNGTAPKKVTIQMKDAQGKVSQHPVGTYVINKNSGNLSGKSIVVAFLMPFCY